MVKKVLMLAIGMIVASCLMAQSAPKSVTINETNVQFWTGTGSNSTVVAIGWDDDDASYTPTVVVWGVRWNGTITLLNALDTIMAYDSRFSYTISGSFLTGLNYVDPSNGVALTPSMGFNCNSYGGVYNSTNLSNGTWLRISESTCDNYNFTGVNNLIYASNPNGGAALPDTVDASLPFSEILYWVGTGSDSAEFIVNFANPDTAFAWGYLFNGSTTAQAMVDAIAAADPRFWTVGSPSLSGDIHFVTDNGDTLGLSPVDPTIGYNFWWTNLNGVSAGSGAASTLHNGDVFKYGDMNSATGWDAMGTYYLEEAWNTIPTPVSVPTSGNTPTEATIAFSDILYWVGEGTNEAVLAVNWADTALAWGYRWNGTATVESMMAAIAAADPRFDYSGTSWLNDITFNDGTVSLAGTPGNYWGSTNNGIMDAGMTQTLADGDFEKWGDPAAGVIVDSNNYGGPVWYYTYAYPMTIYPVSVPAATQPEEATIAFSDILYWVGEGTNEAVLAVNWADTALAWGYRWNGNATVESMMAAIAAADPRFDYSGTSWLNDITFNDGTVSLAGTPGNYWGSTNNGIMDAGMTQALANGDLEKWGDPAAGVIVDSNNYGGPVWYYTYAYPMTIYPVSMPSAAPAVEATIDASAIEYWVGEGVNEAILAVNWADTALAWGYRWNNDATVADMMADIAAADPRINYTMNGAYLGDILYTATVGDTLRGTSWWECSLYSGMAQTLAAGDFVKWADPAAGVAVDSSYSDGWGWSYTYVYPMEIHAVTQPLGAGPFCGIVGTEGCTAIAANSSAILGWATACTLDLGPQNISVDGSPLVSYHTAEDAIGPCTMNDNLSVVSLGDGGSATLTFAHAIKNGNGPDFAVFENSFDDYFLELAFVEVSSDGERFVRFPATSLTQTVRQIGGSGRVDASYINNLAGKYRSGYGTPFDLAELADSTGVDINNITHVRIVDAIGSIDPQYASYDAFGHMVNDPWPTNSYSSGFDLDGIAVLHQVGEGIDDVTVAQVSIYPNPVADCLTISGAAGTEAVLYDMTGRQLFCWTIVSDQQQLNTNTLAQGIYMLRVGDMTFRVAKR